MEAQHEDLRRKLRELAEHAERFPYKYFQPLPHQLSFLVDPSKEKLLRTGNQLGKTLAALLDVLWEALGEHPYLDLPEPPIQAWVICSSFSQSIAVQEKCWSLCPKHRVVSAPYDPKNGFGAKNPMVLFDNGSIIRFKTTNQDTKDLASATINTALFDEPPGDERIYTEVQKRLQEHNGRLLIAMTPINAPVEWLRLRCETYDDEGLPLVSDHHYRFEVANFIPVGSDRPLLLKDGTPKDARWVARIRSRTIERQRAVTLDGEWEMRGEGAVFTAFEPKWEEPKGMAAVRVGMDHGSGRNFSQVCLVGFVTGVRGQERVHIRAEYASDHATSMKEDAKGVLEACVAADVDWTEVDTAYGDKIHDPTKGGRDRKVNDEILAEMAKLRAVRMADLKPRIRNVKRARNPRGALSRGVQWLHECMVDGRFFVHPSCKRLIASLQRWDYTPRQDDRRRAKKSEESDWKHAIDALRYLLHEEIEGERPIVPTLRNG